MRQVLSLVALVTGIGIVLAASPQNARAMDKANYSGKYLAEQHKSAPSGSTDRTLEVVQTADGIDFTKVELGKRTTGQCPFNGSDGDYRSLGGVPGKWKAQFKDKYLILEIVVVTHPQPALPMRMHTKERWQLSADAKILTIKSDVDFPDVSRDVSAVVAGDVSGTQKYMRTDSQ